MSRGESHSSRVRPLAPRDSSANPSGCAGPPAWLEQTGRSCDGSLFRTGAITLDGPLRLHGKIVEKKDEFS